MSKDTGVYLIKNLINGKVYVGSTSSFRKRWAEHLRKLNKGTHENRYLQRSWMKYGAENFSFIVSEVCEKECLIEKEQVYIDLYKAAELGYNICSVAASTVGVPCSEEKKRNLSLKRKGHSTTDAARLKMSLSAKGKKKSDETRRRMSEAKMGHVVSEETRNKLAAHKRSDETKRKISSSKLGIPNLMGRGHKTSEGTRMKMSITKKNMSDETKEKMSLSKHAYWKQKKMSDSVINHLDS